MANSNYISDNGHYISGNNQYYAGNNSYYGGNNPYYGGNNPYYGGNNPYYTNQNNGYKDPQQNDDEESSSFDVMEWVLRFLHYWYLFVIALAVAFSLAMLKNRKWIPTYYSQGTVIIKENLGYGSGSNLLQGFGVDAGYKNVNNQVIMLGSYDLMCRVVDSLPFMQTEYITQGRFKSRNLYRQTPVVIEPMHIDPRAYGMLFSLSFEGEGQLRVQSTNEDIPLNVVTHYGDKVECPFFSGRIMPTEMMVNSGRIYFRFRTKESLVEEFMAGLRLDFVTSGSTVLAMALVSETPERDCDFIDMLAKVYLEQNLERKNEVADNSIRFIDKQLDALSSSLAVSEGAMTNFRQENKFVDVSTYAGQLMSRISSYDQEALQLRLRETYFDYLTNYVNSQIESGAVIAPSTLGLNEPMLASLVGQLNDLRIQRGELTERNVYYAKYTKDIENVKEAIAELVKSMRATLDIEKEDLARRTEEVEKDLQKLPEKELQMVSIERNYRIDDNYYTFFLQKRAEAEIQRAGNMPDNTILDKARTTAMMNGGTKKKTTSTYLMIGLLIPFVLIVLSELLNNKIRTPKEVQKISKFHLIGNLRHAKSQNPTLVHDHPRSTYAEMLRSIRTRMEFLVKRKDKMVVCITSTESGDGKTFLSTNLASLYAMSKGKTLLLDLDIRKPNIHTKLAIENGPGVTNYLIGEATFDDICVHTSLGFDLLRAGAIPPNPGELIHSDKMSELLKMVREQYDYVVIDTSPIGLVPDATEIIAQSDLCLYVIRCLETNKNFAKNTLEQLSEIVENPDLIQIVLSDVPSSGFHGGYKYGYNYKGGYGYGYGYGYGEGRSKYSRGLMDKYHQYRYGKAERTTEAKKHYYNDEDEE